jgi:hypothetical protein
MSKTVTVRVIEELTERRVFTFEVPDDLDTSDSEVLNEFLESKFVDGDCTEIEGLLEVAITERWFEP